MNINSASVSKPQNVVTLSDTQTTALARHFIPYIKEYIAANRDEFEAWRQEQKNKAAGGVAYAANK